MAQVPQVDPRAAHSRADGYSPVNAMQAHRTAGEKYGGYQAKQVGCGAGDKRRDGSAHPAESAGRDSLQALEELADRQNPQIIDARAENRRNRHGLSFIECFWGSHSALTPDGHKWSYEDFLHYGVERAIRECLDARKDPNLGEIPALKNAIKAGQWQGDMKRDIALYLRDMMQTAKKWKESTQAKKPEKDGDYQDTLLVQSWIAGK